MYNYALLSEFYRTTLQSLIMSSQDTLDNLETMAIEMSVFKIPPTLIEDKEGIKCLTMRSISS
jgi:hypothetical protein